MQRRDALRRHESRTKPQDSSKSSGTRASVSMEMSDNQTVKSTLFNVSSSLDTNRRVSVRAVCCEPIRMHLRYGVALVSVERQREDGH